jgi:hypothetical protein
MSVNCLLYGLTKDSSTNEETKKGVEENKDEALPGSIGRKNDND